MGNHKIFANFNKTQHYNNLTRSRNSEKRNFKINFALLPQETLRWKDMTKSI